MPQPPRRPTSPLLSSPPAYDQYAVRNDQLHYGATEDQSPMARSAIQLVLQEQRKDRKLIIAGFITIAVAWVVTVSLFCVLYKNFSPPSPPPIMIPGPPVIIPGEPTPIIIPGPAPPIGHPSPTPPPPPEFLGRWDIPQPGGCAFYATRTYHAHLLDVPRKIDPQYACENVLHELYGRLPDSCFVANHYNITGSWDVQSDEVICKPFFEPPSWVQCTGDASFEARYEARLFNLNAWAIDGYKMCATTPQRLLGVIRPRPSHCEWRDGWGMVGIWDIPVDSCG